ncbi:MAG: uncharacterized protein K0R50_1350 [Eubacterium sp.]|nr:uncharacterized protein [Eubacterium sp.]
MKRKISTVISSMAACAIIVSIFAFNSNAVESKNKAVEPSVYSIEATEAQNPASTAAATALETLKETVSADTQTAQNTGTLQSGNGNPTAVPKAVNLSTTSVKKIANCPTTNGVNSSDNQQTNVNSAIKAKLEALLKSFNGSTSANQINKSTCKKTTVTKPAASTPSASKPATTKPSATKPSTTASTNGDYSAFQKKVVELVNAERAKAGLKPLKMNTELSKVATLKSQDMAKNNYFDHNSPTYGSPFDMMKKYGISYRTAGENIAMGQTTPEQVMNGWMNSPGHRANILKSSFTEIGVGIAKNSSGRLYWTQQFIG